MKTAFPAVLLLLLVTTSSCHKDHSSPTHPLPANTTITINLGYADNIDSLNEDKWELIVKEPGGSLLLDTVVRVNTTISTTLKSSTPLVYLTTVVYYALYDSYSATSFIGVNPSTWTSPISPINFDYTLNVPVDPLPGTGTYVNYIHPPLLTDYNTYSASTNSILLSDYTLASTYQVLTYSPGDPDYQPGGLLTLAYPHHANNPVYVLFPQTGQYNFHVPAGSGTDTVDLTQTDTAVMIHYTVPQPYTLQSSIMYGYTDTTDFDKSMQLWFNLYTGALPADVEYPTTGVQTYQLTTTAYSSTSPSEYLIFYSYGTTIPTSLPFPAPQAYTINSNQQDSFAVTFSSVSPSAYFTYWTVGKITFGTIASPDSTLIHPYTLLAGSGSKLLQGQNLSPLTLQSFYWQQFAGMNYAAELNYSCNPADIRTKRISAATTYSISF
jgi:hypothetical protein